MGVVMTEEEAKKKWCPHARVDSGFAGSGVVNRYPKRDGRCRDVSMQEAMLNETVNCIGSQCMAWRWLEKFVAVPGGHFIPEENPTTGYCGLAGKP